ncbi:MAG: DUF2804 domain-containing protein [Spirochaetes bacterium]|nr:DUF2804 domain-containing protein [Spirochaetota bacterium]
MFKKLLIVLVILVICSTIQYCDDAKSGLLKDQHGKYIRPIQIPDNSISKQIEIKKQVNLLNSSGDLNVAGWSRNPLIIYNEQNIKADKKHIKKWEHYTFYNTNYCGGITISDIATVGMCSIELFDIKNNKQIANITLMVRPNKIRFPSNTYDVLEFIKGKSSVVIKKIKNQRIAQFYFDNEDKEKIISGMLTFTQHGKEAMAIITPFSERELFFYEYKVPSLTVKGTIKIGNNYYDFNDDTTFGVLDWGRGAWPEINQWLWAAGGGVVKGKLLSFNLGYGFGANHKATENGIVYDGKVHKLDKVIWHYNINDYMKPWVFKSNDKRFEMTLQPVYLLHSDITVKEMINFLKQLWEIFTIKEIKKIITTQAYLNKVFGYYSGYVILDDGSKITINNMLGFAEVMYQQW